MLWPRSCGQRGKRLITLAFPVDDNRCVPRPDRYIAARGDVGIDRESWIKRSERGIDGVEWSRVVELVAAGHESGAVGLDRVQLSSTSRIVFLGETESHEAAVVRRSRGSEILADRPHGGGVGVVVKILPQEVPA